MLLRTQHHQAHLLPCSTTTGQRVQQSSRRCTIDEMKGYFGDAWRRLLTLSPSFCPTAGCVEIACPYLVRRMTVVLACMLGPFCPFRYRIRTLHPILMPVNYKVSPVWGLSGRLASTERFSEFRERYRVLPVCLLLLSVNRGGCSLHAVSIAFKFESKSNPYYNLRNGNVPE